MDTNQEILNELRSLKRAILVRSVIAKFMTILVFCVGALWIYEGIVRGMTYYPLVGQSPVLMAVAKVENRNHRRLFPDYVATGSVSNGTSTIDVPIFEEQFRRLRPGSSLEVHPLPSGGWLNRAKLDESMPFFGILGLHFSWHLSAGILMLGGWFGLIPYLRRLQASIARTKAMKITFVAIVFLSLNSAVGADLADTNTYSNPTLGISVTKPKEWVFVTAEQHAESLKRAKLKDEEFLKLVQKYSSAPLVTMTKYAEPYDDLNPSFKLNIKPLGKLSGDDPKAILSLLLEPLKANFDDFKLVVAPREARVAKHKAAYAQMYFTLQNSDGRRFPTCSELWVIPRGKHFVLIGCGTRQDEQTGKRAELEKILSSLKLE